MQKNKKQKLILLLPLIVIPAIIAGFVFMGSGKPKDRLTNGKDKPGMFNAKLPAANLIETGKNKLELYMQAQQEAAKRKEALQNDPYENGQIDSSSFFSMQPDKVPNEHFDMITPGSNKTEKKINDRLEKLMTEINRPSAKQLPAEVPAAPGLSSDANIAQMEQLLASLQQPGNGTADPEMIRIESVLQKLIDLQEPNQNKRSSSLKKPNASDSALHVSSQPTAPLVSGNHFYGLEQRTDVGVIADNTTLSAVVPEAQTISDGSVIQLRLLQDIFIGDTRIAKGTNLSGICAINDERVQVTISDILYNQRIYPIALTAYDTDGIAGLQIRGSESATVAKNGAEQAMQGMDVLSYDPSLAAKAATAGVQTLKGLLSKKIKRVQIHIKAGHKLLLRTASY